jgi:plastocyanin
MAVAVGRPAFWLIITLLAAIAVGLPVQAGTVSGRAVLEDGTPVIDAVITAVPVATGVVVAKPGTKAVMIQTGKQFIPYVLAVQAGTTVDFPNHDSFRHQVYSFSTAKTFELKLYGSGEVGSVQFDKPGAVPVGCNIHDNMLAYVFVTPGPHFATTGKEGAIQLKGLPAGAYTISAWHPQLRGASPTQDITVTADGNVDVKLELRLRSARGQRRPGAFDEKAY